MVVSEQEASSFIQGYTQVMVQIYGPLPNSTKPKLLDVLSTARARYSADHSLLDGALRELRGKSIVVSPEVVSAIQSLELKHWIYLKDTSTYSIFMDPSSQVAYGVLGLTERFKNIIGCTSAMVETGVLRYMGRYVTDGIVSSIVLLGQNHMRDFKQLLADLRKQGKFHKTYTPKQHVLVSGETEV